MFSFRELFLHENKNNFLDVFSNNKRSTRRILKRLLHHFAVYLLFYWRKRYRGNNGSFNTISAELGEITEDQPSGKWLGTFLLTCSAINNYNVASPAARREVHSIHLDVRETTCVFSSFGVFTAPAFDVNVHEVPWKGRTWNLGSGVQLALGTKT